MVSQLDFISNDSSSNPAKSTVFSVKFVFEKHGKKQKRPGSCKNIGIKYKQDCFNVLNGSC